VYSASESERSSAWAVPARPAVIAIVMSPSQDAGRDALLHFRAITFHPTGSWTFSPPASMDNLSRDEYEK
jgi:hypothetical protein